MKTISNYLCFIANNGDYFEVEIVMHQGKMIVLAKIKARPSYFGAIDSLWPRQRVKKRQSHIGPFSVNHQEFLNNSMPRKERERKEAGIASAEFMEGERKKLVQADYQPRRPQDKTAQLSVIRFLTALATERKGEKGGRNCVGRIYGGRKKEACISVQASGAKDNEGGGLYL
ncbi:hypothetical protein Lal_00008289 [Lupinus albus]|nr:hypothetical protein Lal_00008289 [Lupinus albus]